VRGDRLIFGSELKALLAHPAVRPEVTREGLYDILFLGPGRTPGLGIFRDVSELLPGQMGYFSSDGLRLEQYWHLYDAPCTDTFEEASEKTRYLVTDAIRRQLVSDVPLCTFLSGGLDSSIISSVANTALGGVSTYSVDYVDNDRYFQAGKFQPNSDNAYIAIMQDYLQSDHHTVTLDTPELVSALREATEARDLPGMADVDASMLLLSRAVHQTHTVVLSGECADEIFGGYPWYRDPEIRAINGFPWAQTTDYRASFVRPEYLTEEAPKDYVMRRYRDTLALADILPGTSAEEARMKEMMILNLRWFMQTLLDRKDRMSMWSGLEIRVPFCDKRIVEYLYTLPWSYKDYKGREKGLLRHAMRDILPPEIVERKKSPYPKTWNPTYYQAVSDLLRKEIENDSPLLQLCRKDALLHLLEEQRSLPWYGQLMTTPQTIAYFLQIAHWLRKYSITIV
jgi:asparagine synthase (glutamine-hydrolysing)